MSPSSVRVLLVEDDTTEAQHIQEVLAHAIQRPFRVDLVSCESDALLRLAAAPADVILLDLYLRDGVGLPLLARLRGAAPGALVLVLVPPEGKDLAQAALAQGAEDYLVKGHLDAYWLPRALDYLIERKAARDALRCSEARFRAMSDASPLGIFVSDRKGACVYANPAYQRIVGEMATEPWGIDWRSALAPEDRVRVLAEWDRAAETGQAFSAEMRLLRGDGAVVWARLNAAPMDEAGTPPGHVLTVEDISERKHTEAVLRMAEEALFAEKERAQVTLNSIGDAVLTTDVPGNVTYMNLVAEKMTGWTREDALGRPLPEVFRIIDGITRETALDPARCAMNEDRIVGLGNDCLLLRRDGVESSIEDSAAPIHNREGRVTGAVIVFHDVSESRAMAARMTHLAHHDFLTGLPNRALLTERLSQAIGLARRRQKQVALLFLDLDYFKHINDSLGHAIGDQLLQSVADRLIASVRVTDTVCRQGGDEFVILLSEIENIQDAARIADKLLQTFSQPQQISGHELHVTLSIGISVYPDDGDCPDVVLQNADTAMYYAKAAGRNSCQFFRPEMSTHAVSRQLIESALRRALKDGEFLLHYQPQIDLASGRMTGAEALIRWQDPHFGLRLPAQFIAVAEESGLIVPIGRWVLREACRQLRAWQAAGLPVVPLSINISAVEFRHRDFLEGVAHTLAETGVMPECLELELTESILMQDADASAAVLTALKALGIHLALDDFGTGYSSLSYLKRFPIDTLKIDQSFIRDIVTDTGDATIVSAVIDMARKLKQRVIAEGVETSGQMGFLRDHHCHQGQGYHFSHPVDARAFQDLLAKPRVC